MEVVGSEIGQKMRSAIKAKLTELGCYVDDELPDYVMVMVANKRTRAQMEDDLQLFLGENTELFVNWLHQVLKKLQEVTVTAPIPPEPEKSKEKERSVSKDRKSKEKKSKFKSKKTELKKAKKKEKEKVKSLRKKEQKKAHKKKKSKSQEMIRPNIPPLLMNMEKDSEPSITDVFAGQILKNHGILIETVKETPKETKPVINETKRPILPIIDPATILSEPSEVNDSNSQESRTSVSSNSAPKEDQIKEITEIEAKIQGLKQKLAEQLDSMSEDEDFLNIRTEAEELMQDFAEEVFQEISQQTPAVETPPGLPRPRTPTPPPKSAIPTVTAKDPIEVLPQIELNLPKRPIRERLGIREEPKRTEVKEKDDPKVLKNDPKSPESFTPERELGPPRSAKSAKSRLGEVCEPNRKSGSEETTDKTDSISKRLSSRVSVSGERSGRACASVVRVRPRPRAPAPSSLLMRAVADAHKSLLNIPPKVEKEPQSVKRALVLPMRRCVDTQKIVIQVPADTRDDEQDAISLGEPESDDDKSSKVASDIDKDEYVPAPITKIIQNTDYVPSRRPERTSTRKDDTLIIEAINIHNPSVDKDKNTQFIVTMDGFNPNAFLAKKLQTEGLLNDEDDSESKPDTPDPPHKPETRTPKVLDKLETTKEMTDEKRSSEASVEISKEKGSDSTQEKEQETSEAKTIETPVVKEEKIEKRKVEDVSVKEESPPVKRRKSSPIVFDVNKKKEEKEKIRERTESVGSDNHVVVTTTTSSHKYDALPPLTAAEKKLVWCRSFPQCRFGSSCAFLHPRCKFAAACTRRSCVYAHATPPSPSVASHVVPAANYKTISTAPLPAMCKFYPACANPACHFYHPKPCRFGKNCLNKLECNFYHADSPSKWRYPV